MKKDILLAVILIFVAVVSRLVVHEWNFTAIGAVALSVGLLVRNRYLALATPILALVISDYFIGFYDHMAFIYLAYAMMTVVGIFYSSHIKLTQVISATLVGSALFFLMSNFSVWFFSGMYPKTFDGLWQCYMMAVPFFRNELVSNSLLTPMIVFSIQFFKQFLLVRENNVS